MEDLKEVGKDIIVFTAKKDDREVALKTLVGLGKDSELIETTDKVDLAFQLVVKHKPKVVIVEGIHPPEKIKEVIDGVYEAKGACPDVATEIILCGATNSFKGNFAIRQILTLYEALPFLG